MVRFPCTFRHFQSLFPDEVACCDYIIRARWPHGFICPRCNATAAWPLRRRAWTWECKSCKAQTSITAGTAMHKSRLPLTLWFYAAYLIVIRRRGISALQMKQILQLSSYQTAWLMHGKIKRAVDLYNLDTTTMIEEARTLLFHAALGLPLYSIGSQQPAIALLSI